MKFLSGFLLSTMTLAIGLRAGAEPARPVPGQRPAPAAAALEVSLRADATPAQLLPSQSFGSAAVGSPRGSFDYDPTSVYDQKGTNVPRGFSAQAPNELIDPFSGNVVLHHTDLSLPGVAGLDLSLTRVYNSKIHRNYAARLTSTYGMLFDPPSPLGLGWSLHLGRLVGAVFPGPNSDLPGPRYYEHPDGSQHPFFQYTGAGCENETTDVCLFTKTRENLFISDPNEPWRVSTTDGRVLTFGHPVFDGFDVLDYVTSIRDIHGNEIQIAYHDNTITIAGTTHQHEYLKHFIDYIVDSAGRRVDFGYSVVNPGVIRLTSITANGRVYRYTYSSVNPWPASQAFLFEVQPPEGAPWRYAYEGLNDGTCADNSKRWCELTGIIYPAGGTIGYTYGDEVFWAHTNPMSVRAVRTRTTGGREVTPGTWTYTYNRGAQYAGADHTVIARPDGSREISTFFGVASGPYDPFGLAWKAGVLLRKRILDAGGVEVESESLQWDRGPRISPEIWGDPWIGFDNGVFVPLMTQRTLTRGSLSWTTTHTSFTSYNDTPRCTTERSSDGTERYRLASFLRVEDLAQSIRFYHLPEVQALSFTPFSAANCDETQTSTVSLNLDDELTVHSYDVLGQLVHRQLNGVDTDYRYNSDGTLQAEILYRKRDPVGALSEGFCTVHADYRYGVAQRTEQGAPAPNCTAPPVTLRRVVDWFGNSTSQTSGRGFTTGFDRDGLDRIVQIRPPGESPIDVSYPIVSGASASRRVEQGAFWLETVWDGFGRELHISDSTGAHGRQLHDAMGRKVFQGLPSFDPASPEGDSLNYDALGRLVLAEHPDNTSMRHAYGQAAHTVTITDENGHATVQTRRAFSGPDEYWLIRIQLPGQSPPASDQYFYTPGGHLLRSVANGKQRVLQRNFAKKVVQRHDPESGSTYYGYDAAGLLRCRDRNAPLLCNGGNLDDEQAEIRYAMDGLGRVTQVLYSDPDMTDVTNTWDADSNLAARTDAAGTHSYVHDPTNHLTEQRSTILGFEYRTRYAYDDLGFLETLTYPSGRVLSTTRDPGNRVIGVSDPQRVYVSALDYHPDGSAKRIVYGNGVATTLDLDPRQRPQRLRAQGVLDLEYEMDGVGNVTELTDRVRPLGSSSFEYDLLDRLTEASGPWGSLAYTYNAAGDRLSLTGAGSTVTYAYDPEGRVRSLSEPSNLNFLSFLYDGYGNLQERTGAASSTFRYTFDLENRLADITRTPNGGNSSVVRYVYDAEGQRRILERPGCNATRVEHRDAGGTLLAESTEAGRMLREFIVADGRTVAELPVAELAAAPAALQFGQVAPGAFSTLPVTLQNRSSAALHVFAIDVSPAFTIDAVAPLTIAAGASRQISVSFSPGAVGNYEGKLGFCTDNGGRQTVGLQGQSGRATPGLDRSSHHFGNVPFGSRVTQKVMLHNYGTIPLRVDGWSSSHPFLSMEPSDILTVAPGADVELTLVLDTSLGCGGLFQGRLDLKSNSPDQVSLPVYASSTVAFEAVQDPVSLGPLAPGQSRTAQVQFANRAGSALRPRIRLSGSPAFRLDSPQPPMVAPGATFQASVTYTAPVKPWSPFGDHATVSAVPGDGCLPDCAAGVHLAGNVAMQVAMASNGVPGIALAGNSTYVSAIVTGGFLQLAQRQPGGAWSTIASPATAPLWANQGYQMAMAGRPDGLLTLQWREREDAVLISQRVPGQAWTAPCDLGQPRRPAMLAQLPGRPTNFMMTLLPALKLEIDSIDTTHGLCETSPSTKIQIDDNYPWDYATLVAGQDGRVHLVGVAYTEIVVGSPAPGVVPFLEERVTIPAPGLVPPFAVYALRVDPQGRWHVLYVPATEKGPLLYLRRDPDGTASAPEEVVPPGTSIYGVNLAVDSLGGLHAVWLAGACDHLHHFYATKPAGGTWQVTEVSVPGYLLAGDLAMDYSGDRLAVALHGYLPSASHADLLVGEAEVGARNPPPTPVPTPVPPDFLWEGTLQGGDVRQKLLEVGSRIVSIDLVASSGATRAACSVELRLRSPDGVTLGPWTLSAVPLQIPQEAGPGTWTLLLSAQGDCNAQPFRIEARLVHQVDLAAGLALLGAGLLFARRAITSMTGHARRPSR